MAVLKNSVLNKARFAATTKESIKKPSLKIKDSCPELVLLPELKYSKREERNC